MPPTAPGAPHTKVHRGGATKRGPGQGAHYSPDLVHQPVQLLLGDVNALLVVGVHHENQCVDILEVVPPQAPQLHPQQDLLGGWGRGLKGTRDAARDATRGGGGGGLLMSNGAEGLP